MEAARPKRRPQRHKPKRRASDAPPPSAPRASSPPPAAAAASPATLTDDAEDTAEGDESELLLDEGVLAAMEADLGPSDREIARHEDELLSLLGAAPLSSDAPYAAASDSQDAPLASGSESEEKDDAVAGAAHSPSAPAFDDEHDAFAMAHGVTVAAGVMETALAPSAPCLSESEDEGVAPTPILPVSVVASAPPAAEMEASPLATARKQLVLKPQDGLVATGAPEGFPDSSPSGPRTAATPSAPPAMDLDEPPSGFVDASAFSGGANLSPSLPSETEPSAPPVIDIDSASPTGVLEFAPSAPPESTATSTPPATDASVGGAVAVTPSLSPTASKTISRARSLDPAAIADSPAETESEKEAVAAGTVGRVVRDTFAKARMVETSRHLYPSVPQGALAGGVREGGSSFAQVSADGQVMSSGSTTAVAHPKRIHIKLDPFVNFEINLMRAEASQKRQERKMQRIEANKGELFSRLERYLFSEYLLHSSASVLESSKTEVDNLMKKVWTIETKRLSSSQRCGDHVEIEQRMEFQTAKLEPLQLQKLKAHLEKLRQLRTVESSMHTFDRATAYFHVEQYLNGLLHEPNLVAFLNKMSASCGSNGSSLSAQSTAVGNLDLVPEGISFFETLPSGSTLASTVDHLKYCIDVLMYFEKKVTVDEKGSFGRVPHSFYRGELIWHNPNTKSGHSSSSSGHGMVRKIKCYACGCLNSPMETSQFCKLCESCDVVLYLPPSSVSTNSNEWYSSVVRFRESLQKWISACLQSLLRTKLLSNMPYLLMHIMYLPRIGTEERSWLLRYLQFPRAMVATNGTLRQAWSEDLVDHYLAMIHLVFHPEKLRRMSVLVSSGPPASGSAPSAMNGANESVVSVSPEWVLLENPEFLDRCFLSDDDFVAVLNQFPNTFAFEQLFQCTLDTKKSFSRALTLVLELTQSLRAFQEFEKFPVRISQLLGELLVNASQISVSTSAASRTDESIYYPTLFDQLFLTALHGLLVSDCNRIAWKSLSGFPFGSLSELAKWDVLALLLFNVRSVPPEAKSVAGWMKFIQRATSGSSEESEPGKLARETLCDLIASETENAVYLLQAVAHLAASCGGEFKSGGSSEGGRSELVSVAVHELFLAGFTVPACQKALGENGERAAGPISTICLSHPWIISLLISLLFKYHECAATWIHVFETFPVNRWTPTSSDLMNIQEWLLLENTSAPRCALARFLLDHINWEYDIHGSKLFTSPYLHRRVALIVAEAYVLYKTRRERATDPASAIVVSGSGAPQKLEVAAITKSIRRALWLEDTFDFAQWCWKMVLKLKFYSPHTHEPFIELIDLSRDRSREALTLRRWFANASQPMNASIKKVPFYSSLETELEQMAVRTEKEQQAQEIAKSHAMSGGTGAPIQEDMATDEETGKTVASTGITATAALTTEPIVAYLICQITTFVFSDRIDRWEPLLQLLKKDLFHASIRVLDNIFPVLAKFDEMKRGRRIQQQPRDTGDASNGENQQDGSSTGGEALREMSTPSAGVDLEIELCMAAIQSLSTSEMLQLVGVLFDNSYINGEERSKIEDVLQKGYIGGWESTAKSKVLSKLRFVRECSRYLHPALLPALINESFPRSSTTALTTAAILNGAMSWISSTLRGKGAASDARSPSSAASSTAALTMRRSSITGSASSANAASSSSLGMLSASTEYTSSTKALCSLIEREFEYASDSPAFRNAMLFWMKVLLQVPYWFENHEFRHLVDVIVRCSMARDFVSRTETLDQGSSRYLLFELVAALQRAFKSLCLQLKANHEDPSQHDQNDGALVVSFLPPADATTLSAIFGSAFDATQHVGGCSFLALWALLIETRQELALFMAMGNLMLKYEPKTMKKVEKWKKTKGKLASELAVLGLNTSPCGSPSTPIFSRCFLYGHTSFDSLSQYKFYRWCEYCLEMPEHDEAQILFWQVFFALYFACSGGTRVFGHYFLQRDGSHKAKRVHMRTNLQAKLRKMINYCSTQAQVVLTTTGGVGTAVVSSESKEKKYAHFVTLSQIYTAMDAWLEERDPNLWVKEDEFVTLPRHYEVKRLREVLQLSDILLAVLPEGEAFEWNELPLWTNLCGFEFTFRRSQTSDTTSDSSALTSVARASVAGLQRKESDAQDEEDFAFVEEAADLRRRHSSFGSTLGVSNRMIRPLPLLPEHCGPSVLTSLPLVSLSVTEESCVVTPSIQLNKHGLKSVAVKFSENLSVLVALDAELMDQVAQLYSSKTRTVTQSMPCLEGSNCRQAASFRFEFMEWSVDKALLDAAQSILAQSERCDMKAMLTNMTWTLMDHHQAAEGSIALQCAADQFLKLDGDGFMLVMQILLVDQVVRSLDVELQNVRREEQAAASAGEAAVVDAVEGEAAAEKSTAADAKQIVQPAKQWDKVLDRLHEKGLEWFRLLTELDTKLSRMVPPLREVLWRSIKQLGSSFVCVDERETYTLLQLMLEDPTRINLLSDCFYPASAASRFVEMFSKLMSASGSAKLSTEEKLVLLRRFDFREWLQPKNPKSPKPSKFDRETVLVIVLADISALFPADRTLSTRAAGASAADKAHPATDQRQLEEVLRFYAEIVNLICSSHLEDHAEKVLHALVGVHDDYRFHNTHVSPESTSGESPEGANLTALPRPVDAKVWEALVSIPLDVWQRMPHAQIETFVSFISHHMTTLRWQTALTSVSGSTGDGAPQYPIVYWQKIGVLKYFLDLFTIFCRVSPERQQWQLITSFFEPLLSTLYQPASTSESSSICSPWSEQESFATGTAVCSCFVAACSEFLRKKKSPAPSERGAVASTAASGAEATENTKLTQIWTFYLNVLIPHAPVHICKHLHQFLTRIAWEHWCLTLEIVQQMRELISAEKQQLGSPSSESSYPFVSWMVRDILCRMTWKSTDEWLGAQGEIVCSLFLLEFAKLCVELVLDFPHFNPQRSNGQRNRMMPSSNNVLPPYFVNFVKQQSSFWSKWKLTPSDLDALLQFTLEAVKEPLRLDSTTGYRDASSSLAAKSVTLFPANATPALMQDGFTRLQLVLRLLGQVTTIHHSAMSKEEAFSRVDKFVRMLYAVFEINPLGGGDSFPFAGANSSDPSAWLVVLHSASCTVLYEKLDEIVQLYRVDSKEGETAIVTEEVLTSTLVGVLRFCNLPIVESFFKDEQSRSHAAPKGSPSSSVSLSWAKCGNVIFVEIDSLVRDFASAQKSLFDQKTKKPGRGSSDEEDGGKRRGSGDSNSSSKMFPTEAIGNRLGRLLWSFLAFRGGELCCLSGCGRAIASVHVMSQVSEKSIEKWIIEDRRGAWSDLVTRLRVPELSEEEFEGACLEQGSLMTLQVLFMQQLRKAPVLTEAFAMGMLSKLLGWMEKMQISSKNSMTEMKVLFFAAEVTNFLCKSLAEILPSHLKKQTLRQVCELLLKFGNARKQHGIMKAIGIGGSLQYNVEFHVACLTIGVFLRLQTRNSAPLRVDDRIALKLTRTSEKHLRSLEDLLKTKDCFQIGKRMDWMLEFVRSPKHSLADQDEFFVSLFSRMYPSHPWLLAKCTYE